VQGLRGEVFGYAYSPYSLIDFVVEAFAGPHDYLNAPFWYDSATGNIKSGISPAGKFVGGVINWANVPISSIFVVPSIILPSSNTFP
jgi:filamentous hemagglutinin